MSGLYASRSRGVEPGLTIQRQREAAVCRSIPGGDKELPSEMRRSPAEPESARRLAGLNSGIGNRAVGEFDARITKFVINATESR